MPAPAGSLVVPLDGSTAAEHALPLAARVAAGYDLTVAFVHVQEEEAGGGDDAEQKFRAYCAALAQRHGLRAWTSAVLRGRPADEVLGYAAGARFLCLASHGRGGFQAMLVGSVADKIVRGAEVPVFFVPATGEAVLPGPDHPVMAAVDGSREAERGLELARDVAAKLGARVALVRAYSVPPPVGVEFVYYSPDVYQELEEAAAAYLKSVARPGEATYVVQGAPAAAIETAANEADAGLVTVATRGLGLARRLILGSTTDRLMRTLRRPLLIVPPAD
jgi:nucleotide-binding universal stress UspA family protein